MAECSIRLEKFSKSYSSDFLRRRHTVLKDVSLEVRPGETFAYLGHNGAGKTTTIKALLGLIRVDAGHVELLGCKPGDRNALARVGYVPENPYFYDHLTGRELLALMADLHGLDRDTSAHRVEEILELVEMKSNADRRMRTYSKGMLQRIGMGQALINDPELLVLDEPMGGLDPMGRHHIRAIVAELKARGKTIFLSSHILSDVEAIADRAAIISEGQLRRVIDLNADERSFRRMELQCRGLTPEEGEGLRDHGFDATTHNDITWIRIDEPHLVSEAILAVQATSGQILQLGPVRTSLEDIFVREIAASGHGSADTGSGDQTREQVRRILDHIEGPHSGGSRPAGEVRS